MMENSAKKRGGSRQTATERLVEGERIVSTAQIHPGIYWKAVAVFIVSLLVLAFIAPELGLFLALVAALMAAYASARRKVLMLAVTDRRILVRYGLLQVEVVDIHFDKIESIELERMITGYLMGYANIVIMGTGNRLIVIPYVANGVEIRRAYNEMTLGKSANP
jgi:hypothetical protein